MSFFKACLTKARLGITQQFQLFFIVTAIIPLLLVGGNLVHTVHSKFNEQFDNLLHTGGLLTSTVLRSDLEALELRAVQAGFLSVADEYETYLRTRQPRLLEEMLNRLLEEGKRLDWVLLSDADGRLIASNEFRTKDFSPSIKAMIEAARAGRPVSSIERVLVQKGQPDELVYAAAAPVRNEKRRIVGVLLLMQRISSNFSFQSLSELLPGLHVRIYRYSANGPQQAIFSSLASSRPLPAKFFPSHDTNEPYSEAIGVVQYKSLYTPIRNFMGEWIGETVISVPESANLDLDRESVVLTVLYFLSGLFWVVSTGWWFNRSFVNPVNELAGAASAVASGDLSIQVPERRSSREMRRVIRDFNRMVQRLAKSEKLRDDFISTLTHDMRTPLLAERRVFQIFQEYREELPSAFASLTDGLCQSNAHLLDMVNLLLESYRYEAAAPELQLEPVSIGPLVQSCLDKLRPLAASKRIRLLCDIPDDLSPIYVDAAQIKRVFINLLGNALENIPDESDIQIEAKSREHQVEIQLRDNGPGLPPAVREQLFERYAAPHHNRQKIGSGLGLYICRMIVEQHQGTIEVLSNSEQGTTFCIKLPIAPVAVAAEEDR